MPYFLRELVDDPSGYSLRIKTAIPRISLPLFCRYVVMVLNNMRRWVRPASVVKTYLFTVIKSSEQK